MGFPMAVTHEDIVLLTQMPKNSEVRPKPSPAFNAETKDHIQPLVGRKNDMDESYVAAEVLPFPASP
jgi:hypothetical protein